MDDSDGELVAQRRWYLDSQGYPSCRDKRPGSCSACTPFRRVYLRERSSHGSLFGMAPDHAATNRRDARRQDEALKAAMMRHPAGQRLPDREARIRRVFRLPSLRLVR